MSNNINMTQIKYLDETGLLNLWGKISDTFVRNVQLVDDLTKTSNGIISSDDEIFIQNKQFTEAITGLAEEIEKVAAAQGTNIDNETIINTNGKLQTNLMLHNDKNKHILNLCTKNQDENGQEIPGVNVGQWDYSDFYAEAIKDGFLETVSLVVVPDDESQEVSEQAPGTYLKFVWNTNAVDSDPKDKLTQQVTYVNVSDLIDVYEGSTYINIESINGTSTVSLNTTELCTYLRKQEALGIDSIVTVIEDHEKRITDISTLIGSLESALADLEGIKATLQDHTTHINEILDYLKTVPNTPIRDFTQLV
jgi:hypothetical protein